MASIRGRAWIFALSGALYAGCSSPPTQPMAAAPSPVRSVAGSPATPQPSAAGSAAPAPTLPAAPSGMNSLPSMPGDVPVAQPTAAPMPCDVGKVVSKNCGTCHGATPIGGAPMSLVTQADFSKQLKSVRTAPDQTLEVAQLVKMRVNDDAKPMPPGGKLADADLAVLNKWLDAGHPAGAASDSACAVQTPADTTIKPTVRPDGTTCYQFKNHGQPMPGDTTPYGVVPGEHYVSFYYNAPWKAPSELVSWRTIYDNTKVLHHWLLYSTLGDTMDGTFAPSIGTHIGDAANLLAGWAVGGNDSTMPPDVGLQLPPPGGGLLLEWHYYNNDPAPQMDASAVEICTVPAGSLKHTAGMTWLGTENFNGPLGMPPKTESKFSGTCLPGRAGMNASDPIHIFTLWPHMHTYGRHMHSTVNRADGTTEEVFDKPFDFNYQITYPAAIDLYPGDSITSTCTFQNTSNDNVAFGPSTEQEMCYQFAFSYPVGALENNVLSLVGATNTCW